MKECKYVYLDKNYEESKLYKQLLSKYSKEKAEKIYLREMQYISNAKFSINNDIKDMFNKFVEDSLNDIKAPEENGNFYTKNGIKLDRATMVIQGLGEPFIPEDIAKKSIINSDYYTLIKKRKLDESALSNVDKEALYKEIYDKYDLNDRGSGDGNSRFQALMKEKLALYDFKREGGTNIHESLEYYMKLMNENKSKDDADKLSEKEILRKALGKNGSNLDSIEFEEQKPLVENVYKLLEDYNFPGGLENCEVVTELRVADIDMNIAGSIDLIIRDGNGTLHIFDYKTKEKGKEDSWASTAPYIKNFNISGHNIKSNKENTAAIQTGIYKEILERQGFKVSQPAVIYIEGKLKTKNPNAPIDDYTNYYYSDFSKPKLKPLPNYRNAIVTLFKERTSPVSGRIVSTDLDEKWKIQNEEGKVNSITEYINTMINLQESKTDYRRTALRKLNDIKKDKSGKQYVFGPTREKIYFKSIDQEKRIQQLQDYYKDFYEQKDKVVDSVIAIFNGNKQKRLSPQYLGQIKTALSDISKETHFLSKLNAEPGLKDIPSNFLIATNKLTGVKSIIIIENQDNQRVKWNKQGKRTSIYGNYLVDTSAKIKYGKTGTPPKGTSENFNFITAAMAVMYLKNINPDLKLDTITYNYVIPGKEAQKPQIRGMATFLPHIKNLLEISKNDKTLELNTRLNKFINSDDKYNIEEYTPNYLDVVYANLNSPGFTSVSDLKSSVIKSIEEYKQSITTKDALVDNLNNYLLDLQKSGGTTYKDVARNREYGIISEAILQLKNIDYTLSNDLGKVEKDSSYRSLSRISNDLVQGVNSSRDMGEKLSAQQFYNYKKKQAKYLKDFLDEATSSTVSKFYGPRTNNDVYKILYKNPELDPKKGELLELKSSDELRKEGLPKAAAFVDYFNKMKKEAAYMLYPNTKEDSKGLLFSDDLVPIMGQSVLSQSKDMSIIKNPKKYVSFIVNNMLKENKNVRADDASELENPLIRKNWISQNNERGRNKELGVDFDGHVTNPDRKVETNLEIILDKFYVDALRVKHLTDAMTIYRASQGILASANMFKKINTEPAMVLLNKMIQLTLTNEINDEGMIGAWIDKLNNLATTMNIAYSPRQMMVELSTNLIASSGAMFTQEFKSMMGGNKRFGIKDWTKAGTMLTSKKWNQKLESVIQQSGIMESDIDDLKDTKNNLTAKNSWGSAKVSMNLNSLPLRTFRTQIFLSEMIRDNVLDAYGEPDKFGISKYNEKRDPRFFDVYGKFKSKDAEKKYNALREVSENEGTLDAEGNMTRPYSLQETIAKRDYYKDIFGGLGKEVKALTQLGSLGRAALKFKYWWIAKKDFYYTDNFASKTRKEWKKIYYTDEDGKQTYKYSLEAEPIEGVIQTYKALYNNCMAYVSKSGYSKEPLTDLQKENLVKSLTDLASFAIWSYLISMIFDLWDDDLDSETLKYFKKGALMGAQDANFILATTDLLTKGGLAAGIGAAITSVRNAFRCVMAGVTGDLDIASDKMFNMMAFSRFSKAVTNDMMD